MTREDLGFGRQTKRPHEGGINRSLTTERKKWRLEIFLFIILSSPLHKRKSAKIDLLYTLLMIGTGFIGFVNSVVSRASTRRLAIYDVVETFASESFYRSHYRSGTWHRVSFPLT